MPSTVFEVLWLQIQCLQFAEVFRPQTSKFIQQLRQRLSLTLSHVSPTVKRFKRASLTKLEDHLRPRHPIGAFAVNKMADDIKGAPGILTLISQRPGFRQITQQGIESGRSASEKRYRVLQDVFHPAPRFVTALPETGVPPRRDPVSELINPAKSLRTHRGLRCPRWPPVRHASRAMSVFLSRRPLILRRRPPRLRCAYR